MPEQKVYQVQAYFLDQEGEHSSDILFMTDSDDAAVLAGWRWVRNRQRVIPSYFGLLAAIKINGYTIATPDSNGYISTGMGFGGYEWKYDRGIRPLVTMDGSILQGAPELHGVPTKAS